MTSKLATLFLLTILVSFTAVSGYGFIFSVIHKWIGLAIYSALALSYQLHQLFWFTKKIKKEGC